MVIPDYAKVGPIGGATTLKLVPSDGATKVMLSGKRAAARFMLARELAGVKHDPLVKETHYRLDRALTRPWPAGGEEALEFLRAAALDTRFDEVAAAALSEKMAVVQARYSRWLPVEDDDGNLTWEFDPGTVDPAMVAQARADLTELGWDKHLFPFAFADAAEILTKRDALVATFMGYGKCVAPETRLVINGVAMTAEQAFERFAGPAIRADGGLCAAPNQTIHVDSMDASGRMIRAEVKELFQQHINEKVKRITLEDGRVITSTLAHRFYDGHRWLHDPQPGTYLAIPSRLAPQGEARDLELVRLLAWMLAEGYERRNIIEITQKDPAVLEELAVLTRRLNDRYNWGLGKISVIRPDNRSSGILRFCGQAFVRFLSSIGYSWGDLSAGKVVPDYVMTGDAACAAEFIGAYFAGDGYVSPKTSNRVAEIVTASPTMAFQLQELLARLGVRSSRKESWKAATNGWQIKRPYWRVSISGAQIPLLAQAITIPCDYKQARLEFHARQAGGPNLDGVPAAGLVVDVMDHAGIAIGQGFSPNYRSDGSRVSRAALMRLQTYLEEPRKPKKKGSPPMASLERLTQWSSECQRLLDQELYFAKVVSVEYLDYEGYVYDLSVPEAENFVAEGVVCHNTRLALAASEVFRWREGSQSPTIILALKRHLGAWREELGGVPEMPPCELITMQYGRDCYEEWTESGHQPTFQKPFLLLSLERLRLLKADELSRLQIVARGSSLILDEAYVVANMDSKLSRALAQLEGAHHLALSGTPVRSYIDQLLNILMWTLRGGSISLPEYPREAGSRQRWNAQWLSYAVAEGGGSRKKIPFIRNQEALNDLLAPLMKRRLRNEPEVVKILGEANIIPVRLPVDLDPQHRDNYRAVLQEFTDWYTRELEVRGKPGAFPANELLVKLGFLVWNVAAPWRMEDHSDEQFTFPAYPEQPTAVHLEAMRLAQEELEEGNRVIIAGRSTLALDMIARELRARDVRVGLIHGGIPDEKRRLVIAQARRGEIEVLVGSSGVIAEGLNLNFANRMIVTEYTWDPATLAQLMARITRGVQTSAPKAYLLYARGTIQEYMLALMESKKDGASAALDRTRQDADSPIPDIHVYAHSLAGIEGEDQVEARVYYLDESA